MHRTLASVVRSLLCLLAVAGVAVLAPAQTENASPVAPLRSYRFGGDPAVLDRVAQWVSESRAESERRREAARALAEVLQSDAAFDAKQFACRQLVLVASEEQVPVLAALLQDEALAGHALMVLSRIPGGSVDAALRRELPRCRGGARLAVMNALAGRRDAEALPLLTRELGSSDAAASEAAASALARIGGRDAAQAIRTAYERAAGARRLALGYALVECADGLARRGDSAAALPLYQRLDRGTSHPALRAAALRGIVKARGAAAVPVLLKALAEDGTPRQRMAAALAREVPGTSATRRLCEGLPALPPAGRVLLLSALAERGDRTALPALLTQARGTSAPVRAEALRALGVLGDASTAGFLISVAASRSGTEREAARASLVRLRGTGVDQKLLEALRSAQAGAPAEAILALGQRGAVSTVPSLIQAARRTPALGGTAAVRALRDLGRPAHLPALVDLLLARPPAERDDVIETISEVARRGADESQRTAALLAALSRASKPADRASLLALLGQVGGPGALKALRGAATDPSPQVRMAALSRLAEWPTDEPIDDLLRTVRSPGDSRERAVALRGLLRMLAASPQRPPEQALELYQEAAALARGPEEKRLVLAGLGSLRSPEALEYARGFLAEEAVRAEAELAVTQIARGILGAWPQEARAALETIAQTSARESVRTQARDALALLRKLGDFVTAWEVSPAYQQAGADCSRLFDLPFPPEQPADQERVPWRVMPAGTNPEQPWLLDLLALWGGEQRVAYLRTRVWSDRDQDLVLELGSDDGVKVWWNGQMVHAANVQRAVAPAQERVRLQARRGWNPLMLKVTQNVMGWGACARLTHPDGSPATDLRVAVSPAAESHAEGASLP